MASDFFRKLRRKFHLNLTTINKILVKGTDLFVEQHRRELNEPDRYLDGRKLYNVNDRIIDEKYFDINGFSEPIYFPAGSDKTPEGLWIAKQDFNIDDVFDYVGSKCSMRYTDSQTQVPYNTSFEKWKTYFKSKGTFNQIKG